MRVKNNKELELLHSQVLDWIDLNEAQFERNGKKLYDEENLVRIQRFANAPLGYLTERIELNKEVLKSYHKLHHTILLAGFTGFYAIILSQSILKIAETEIFLERLYYLALILSLLIGALIAIRIKFTSHILRGIGLLRVIRDSEIEIYYLTKIIEGRCPKSEKIN